MAHTVMVTGADGFIGSHLTEELVKRGEKVRAFCLYNSFGSLGWIDTLPPEIRNEIDIFMGDVRDPNGVRTAMRGQERVFHLAALIAIPFSYHSPDSYVDTNIKGTLNVLNAARELDTQRVLVTSTSEVYGTAQYVPIDEKHPFQGQSPYSATKIGADRLAESFYRSFDLPVTIVRPLQLPELVFPLTTITVGYPDSIPAQVDRLPLEAAVHQETYHDYTSEDIDKLYAYKESLPENKQFIEENQKETLAQVFTDIRYTKKDNEFMSDNLLKVLRQQGFLK